MEASPLHILLNTSNHALYISREVLECLGMPDYIQILLNAESLALAVRGCPDPIDPKNEPYRLKVVLGETDSHLEIKGQLFVNRIVNCLPRLEGEYIHRIAGEYIKEHEIVLFNLKGDEPLSLDMKLNKQTALPQIYLHTGLRLLRIPSSTIKLLNNPQSIRFQYNPKTEQFLIESARKDDDASITIGNGSDATDEYFNIFCDVFMEKLVGCSAFLQHGKQYSISGKYLGRQNAILFPFNSSAIKEGEFIHGAFKAKN